jgi:mono/diheme cytochrome c family protein
VHNLLISGYAITVLAGFLILKGPSPAPSATAFSAGNQRTADVLYSKHCASCHGSDGRSKTSKGKRNRARNLTEPGWQEAVSDERIFNSIANGRGKMPAFSKKMSEAEIDSLVLVVRGMRSS